MSDSGREELSQNPLYSDNDTLLTILSNDSAQGGMASFQISMPETESEGGVDNQAFVGDNGGDERGEGTKSDNDARENALKDKLKSEDTRDRASGDKHDKSSEKAGETYGEWNEDPKAARQDSMSVETTQDTQHSSIRAQQNWTKLRKSPVRKIVINADDIPPDSSAYPQVPVPGMGHRITSKPIHPHRTPTVPSTEGRDPPSSTHVTCTKAKNSEAVIIPMEETTLEVTKEVKECPTLDTLQGYHHPTKPVPDGEKLPDYTYTHQVSQEPAGEVAWDAIDVKDLRDSDVCCACCLGCFKPCYNKKMSKVTPEQVKQAQAAAKGIGDLANSPEFNPPEGRNLFFEDGLRRIDYVLAWKKEEKEDKAADEREETREVFFRNLEEEGLELQYDKQDEKEMQYVLIHAPWEVLTRYAELLQIRMPVKESPEEIQSRGVLEMMGDYMAKMLSPFELDPLEVPPVPKRFTHVFERDKEYLFNIPEPKELFFSHATRSRIVDYILRRKKYSDEEEDTFSFGIKRLLTNGIFDAAYPLHEGSWKPYTRPSTRRLLYEYWAHWRTWYKVQPLDYIRIYFGERIGLYFAWLGYYTYALLPASIVGLIVFIYGVATLGDFVVADESCDPTNNFTMCPKCDKRCPYWNYAMVCNHVEASHLFDNGATVLFAVFMSLWGVFFLEFWKREQAGIQFSWNLMGFEEEEEPPRPEYLIKLSNSKHKKKHKVTGVEEPYMPFWKRQFPVYCCSISIMLFLMMVAVSVVVGVIMYRMAVLSALYFQDDPLLYNNASMVTSATAAIINLILIFILNFIYSRVAVKLTDWECHRTQSEYDNSLTFKLYTLQFINYYSSLFYIAFFKGRFTGRPGDYNTLFGARQEECQAGGCLIELCIQLSIIFVGKQLIQNNIVEIFVPRIKRWIKKKTLDDSDIDKTKLKPWDKDYMLEEPGQRALFDEYLEMLLQFGFVTIFVAAFPLAPLFAWLNNIIEIRADADKFVTQFRRPLAIRAESIGIWFNLLYGVSQLSVLTNAFIIAVTSGFVHRLVYVMEYSDDGSLAGYVNYSLSYFNVSDFDSENQYYDPEGKFNSVEICRYADYRNPPWDDDPYAYSSTFWHVVAAQFIFIVVFENVVILCVNTIAFIIPDMPRRLKEQVRREAYLTNEIIMKTELEITHGEDGTLSDDELNRIRRRVTAAINKPIYATLDAPPGGKEGDTPV